VQQNNQSGHIPGFEYSVTLAIRTAKWPATFNERCSEMDLDREIAYAAQLAGRVLAALVGRHESIFPSRMEPWYKATDDDSPK